jgi:2-polyprenyl-6-methoxyphenol hydroxylase-like FAD-dependent oxidoreductase
MTTHREPSPPNSTTDVVICGAGAAGLALAVDLARRDVAVLLVDRATEPFHGSRGKGIQPRSQEVFEDLGVLDRLAAAGGPYPRLRRVHREGGAHDTPAEQSEPTPGEPYQAGLLVPQFLTEAVLRERLAELGRHPRYGHELTGFDQDEGGVTARLSGPHGTYTVRARYLIGTDGGSSFVRRTLAIGFPGESLGARAIVADVRLEGLSSDAWHRWDEPPDEIGVCPLTGTDLFQIQAPVPLDGEVDLSAAGLTALLAARTGRRDIVVRSVSWASAYSMSARLADSYRVGRVFLAGDAAHVHPPTGGQGLNTSVQDAYNLGWKLAAVLTGAPERLLDTYEEERRPIAVGMLGLATSLLRTAREGGERRRGREVRQLDLHYRDSWLSLRTAGGAAGAGLVAGDRAPDAPVVGAAGQPTRLFTLLQGTHWTLLGYDVDRGSAVQPRAGLHIHTVGRYGDIIDSDGELQKGYGLSSGDWVLIRPDGYIGAILADADNTDLSNYLHDVGLVMARRASGLAYRPGSGTSS